MATSETYVSTGADLMRPRLLGKFRQMTERAFVAISQPSRSAYLAPPFDQTDDSPLSTSSGRHENSPYLCSSAFLRGISLKVDLERLIILEINECSTLPTLDAENHRDVGVIPFRNEASSPMRKTLQLSLPVARAGCHVRLILDTALVVTGEDMSFGPSQFITRGRVRSKRVERAPSLSDAAVEPAYVCNSHQIPLRACGPEYGLQPSGTAAAKVRVLALPA
jgi:hypothetical protein